MWGIYLVNDLELWKRIESLHTEIKYLKKEIETLDRRITRLQILIESLFIAVIIGIITMVIR